MSAKWRLIGLAMGVVWAYAAFVGKLTEPMPLGEKLFVLVRVALLPGLMCGLTFLSLAKPWGFLLLIGLIAGLSFWADRPTPEVAAPAAA
jgi:hypothetical protein